jgi:hypothetical protein
MSFICWAVTRYISGLQNHYGNCIPTVIRKTQEAVLDTVALAQLLGFLAQLEAGRAGVRSQNLNVL